MNLLVTAALVILGGIFAALAFAGGIAAAWRSLGRRRGASAALAVFAVVATICAQKPGPSGPTITIDALLRDAGCYATNDVFHAAVSNAPAYAAIDFSACPVLVYARERGQTNAADWAALTPRRTFSGLPADYAIANATNHDYLIYLDYIPPSPVHTNGVFELHGFLVPQLDTQLAAGFINSRAILPPPTARDYIQDGLIAMWDGIENAGWGIHDASATVWKDLVGNRDWTLGTSTSYEWTANSFDAKNQYAATQDFVSGALVDTVEICAKTKYSGTPSANVAFVIIGRSTSATTGSYFGLLYRNQFTSMMSCYGFYANTYSSFKGLKTSFSFPSIKSTSGAFAYFNGTRMNSSGNNTLDYMETQRGSVARIGGIATFAIPVEVFNIRLYSRTLSADEIRHNYEIDKERFNLP